MKRIIFVVAIVTLFSIYALAGVITVERFNVAKNPDGTFSISFELAPVPAGAHIDLVVLYIEVGSTNFAEPIDMTLKDGKVIVARGGVGKTRAEILGKQQAQFLLTQVVQNWVGRQPTQRTFLLETRSRAALTQLDAALLAAKLKLIVYYTMPD